MSEYRLQECLTPESMIVASNIRYQAYTSVGYEPVSTSGLFTDEFDGFSGNQTFLLYRHGRPVATVRSSIASLELGLKALPCSKAFDPIITHYLQHYSVLVEMNRMAVLPGCNDDRASIPMMLFSAVFPLVKQYGSVLLCCASGKQHARYYQRMGFLRQTDFADRPGAGLPLALLTKELFANALDFDPVLKAMSLDSNLL